MNSGADDDDCERKERPSWNIRADSINIDPGWKPLRLGTMNQMKPYVKHLSNAFKLQSQRGGPGRGFFKDTLKPNKYRPAHYGAPIGGIGSGTIGRGIGCEFCRYQLLPGRCETSTCYGTGFMVTVRRNGESLYQYLLGPKLNSKQLLRVPMGGNSKKEQTYSALYPCSTYTYELPFVRLVLKQVSPFLPHNYKDSCLPLALFECSVQCSKTNIEVTISFLWQSGSGETDMTNVTCKELDSEKVTGVCLAGKYGNTPLYFVTGVQKDDKRISVTKRAGFDPDSVSSSLKVWKELVETGELSAEFPTTGKSKTVSILSAKLSPSSSNESETSVRFVCVWHMPQVRFENSIYRRYYADHYGAEEADAFKIATYGLESFDRWNSTIKQWQNKILDLDNVPDIVKVGLINEMYFIADGGSVWLSGNLEDHEFIRKWGKFAILEGIDIQLYNTYDVLYYASSALIDLFPNLQLSIQYGVVKAITSEDCSIRSFLTNPPAPRKRPNTCPHDIGSSNEHPWLKLNAFPISDTSEWKDLNLKFILIVYRDYKRMMNGGAQYLNDMWPTVKIVIDKLTSQTSLKGVIENNGSDQTFDTWPMFGLSAYCGGLQMCALKAAIEMAKTMDDQLLLPVLEMWLCNVNEKMESELWNGSYYNFDSSTNKRVFAVSQLSGLWMLLQSGADAEDLYPRERVISILKLFQSCHFRNGLGFVNGTNDEQGKTNTMSIQSEEIWTGITFAIVSMLVYYDMKEEAMSILSNVFNSYYNQIGLAFQTPEALSEKKKLRHIGYLRPLSVWSVAQFLCRKKPNVF